MPGKRLEGATNQLGAVGDQVDTATDHLTDQAAQTDDDCEEKGRVIRLHNRARRVLGLGELEYTRELFVRAALPTLRPTFDRESLEELEYQYLSGERHETPHLREVAAEWVGLSIEELLLPATEWRARFGDLLTD